MTATITGVVVGRHVHRELMEIWPCSRCGIEVKVNTKRKAAEGTERWEFECKDCKQVERYEQVVANRKEAARRAKQQLREKRAAERAERQRQQEQEAVA